MSTPTYQFLHTLQTTIGPRVSGSDNEARTIAWLENNLQSIGLSPEREAFIYQPERLLSLIASFLVAVGIMALGAASAAINSLLVMAGMVVLLTVYDRVVPLLRQKTGTTQGYNVIAGITRPWSEILDNIPCRPLALLCAHYDTARGYPAWFSRLLPYEESFYGLGIIGMALLSIYCVASSIFWLLQLVNVETVVGAVLANLWSTYGIWLFIILVLPGAVLIFLEIGTYVVKTKQLENPGADDNGSGVATVLAVTEQITHLRSNTDWDIAVAFWGAEEVGLVGSRQFVRQHRARLDPNQTVIINLDGVGRGQCLGVVTGHGMMWRKAVNASLINTWQQTCKSLQADTIHFWMTILSGATDQAVWLEAKFTQALSIGCSVPAKMPLILRLCYRLLNLPGDTCYFPYRHIHSPEDTLEGIQPEALDLTTRAVRALIERLVGTKPEPAAQSPAQYRPGKGLPPPE